MAIPTLPETTSIDGTETVIVRQGMKPFRALLSRIFSSLIKPLRVERYTAATNTNGIATITFPTPFAVAPDVQAITSWTGEQMIAGGVTAVSTTGCTVQAMVSRGTLLLTSGPFQKAGAGVNITVRAIGT